MLLNTVKELLQLRKKYSALKAVSKYQCIYAEKNKYPYIYKRAAEGQEIAVVINPSERAEICQNVKLSGEVIYSVGETRII